MVKRFQVIHVSVSLFGKGLQFDAKIVMLCIYIIRGGGCRSSEGDRPVVVVGTMVRMIVCCGGGGSGGGIVVRTNAGRIRTRDTVS